jgi:hypothetical protein
MQRGVCRAPTRPSRRCDHAWRNEQFYRYERDYEADVFEAKIRQAGGRETDQGREGKREREREREEGVKGCFRGGGCGEI